MKALAPPLFIGFAALFLIAVSVFVAGDTQTFVPAPEAEVENFMRALVKERYETARTHLASPLREQSGVEELRERRQRLVDRSGDIEEVSAEPGEHDGRRARATAVLRTRGAGQTRLQLWLSRESGLWRISGFGDLTR